MEALSKGGNMPRNNSLVGKVRRALRGLVIKGKTENEVKKVLYQEVRKEIIRGGVRKNPDTVAIQSDMVTQSISREIKNLNEGGVVLSL